MELDVVIFGKHGCQKCELLQRRTKALLEEPQYKERYRHEDGTPALVVYDALTVDGLVALCKAEVVGANKIPAIALVNHATGELVDDSFLPENPNGLLPGQLSGKVGLSTDYDGDGHGVIPPAWIRPVLDYGLSIN